jgi:beta-N-acetylhexosaminidase
VTPWRRRLVALAVAGAAGGGALALATGAPDPERVAVVPEGGSGFRPEPSRKSGPAGPRTPKERAQQRRADAKLPVPLARAAARLFLVGFSGTTPDAPFFERLKEREWGAVLVDRANVVDAAQLTVLTAQIDLVARDARRLPPLVAAAQLGGREVAVKDIGPARQASIESTDAARREARRAGRSLLRLGFDMVLAPSADLSATGGPWEQRGFSDEPAQAARLAAAAVSGWRGARIAPVVGHFPGEGTASQDPELGVATVGLSREKLRERDQKPFRAVQRRAPAIQLSGALYADFDGATPATLTPAVVQTLRRQGFRGAIVSSNLTAATQATGEGVGAAAVAALKAGCDVLYVPGDQRDQEEAYRAVVRAVRIGTIPTARVRQALDRIDRLRRAAG